MTWDSLQSTFQGFRFAQPEWLWLLTVIPLLWLWLGHRVGASAIAYSSLEIIRDLGRQKGGREGWVMNILLYLTLTFLILGMARPQSGHSFSTVRASGVDILLVVDVSSSMLSEDFTVGGQRANRLSAVKEVTEDFIETRTSDRMGIMAFAAKPFLVSPLTLDHPWLLQNLQRINIDFDNDGTAIGSAIRAAANRLKDRESESRIIVLLTDGTNNSGRIQPVTAAEAAEALGIKIYTIGAGTEGFAPFPVLGRDRRQIKNIFGEPAYERVPVEFDEETLKVVAEMTGGKYFRATGTDSLKAVYDEIDQLEKTEVEVDQYEEYEELFWWFVIPGAALGILMAGLRHTLWRRLP